MARFYNYIKEASEIADRLQRERGLIIYNELYQFIMRNKNNLEKVLKKRDMRPYKNPVWILNHSKINKNEKFDWIFVFNVDDIFNYENEEMVLPIIKTTYKEIPKELPKYQREIMHELIHYLDDTPTGKGYYNSPEEFNAYYQESIEYVYKDLNRKKISNIKNINDFIKMMKSKYLDRDFIKGLNSTYMRKLNKRLVNLYETLKIEKWL